jgi:transposase
MRYGNELRKKVSKMLKDNVPRKTISKLLNIGTSTLSLWKKLHQEGKLLENETWKRGPKCTIDKEQLRQLVLEKPDLYLSELEEIFGISDSRLSVLLKEMGLNLKKRSKSTEKQIKKIEQDL